MDGIDDSSLPTDHLGSRRMKRCPDCAEEVQDEARICRFCGYAFDGSAARTSSASGSSLSSVHSIQSRSLLGIGILAAVAMLIGAFGPWLKVSAAFLGSVSVSGTDGGNDGWIVVAASLVGAFLFYAALISSTRTSRIFTGVLALAAGAAALATCIYDRNRLSDPPAEVSEGALISIGWGLNLALAASAVFVVTTGITAFSSPRRSHVN
jgi:hypothetical protein